MARDIVFEVLSNERIARDVFRMVLSGDTSDITRPGQFVNLKMQGCFLRRPISVCDWDEETITLVYRVVGQGTQILSALPIGARIPALSGLGNGYDMAKSGKTPILIGGGVGVPPLYGLARRLVQSGITPQVILGFRTADDVILASELAALGVAVTVCTEDGSAGVRGYVTDALAGAEYSYFYTCGPEAMFRAIERVAKTSGQYSFEERMGCGFGACMGCSCKTLYGNKRICVDGPVLEREEILWQTQE